jgi:hypothetical protein
MRRTHIPTRAASEHHRVHRALDTTLVLVSAHEHRATWAHVRHCAQLYRLERQAGSTTGQWGCAFRYWHYRYRQMVVVPG